MHSQVMGHNGPIPMAMAMVTIRAVPTLTNSLMTTLSGVTMMGMVMVTMQMETTRTFVQTLHLVKRLIQQDVPTANSMMMAME